MDQIKKVSGLLLLLMFTLSGCGKGKGSSHNAMDDVIGTESDIAMSAVNSVGSAAADTERNAQAGTSLDPSSAVILDMCPAQATSSGCSNGKQSTRYSRCATGADSSL